MSPVKMKRPAAGKAKATPKKSPATPNKSPATPKKSPAAPKKSPVKKHTGKMKKPSAPPKVLKKPSGKLEEKTKPEEEKSKQRTEKNKKKRAEEKKKKEEEAQKKAAEAAKKKGKGGSKGSKGLKEEAEKETGCQEEGGEEEQEEVDPLYEDAATFEEETEPKKDRCKDKKFKALLASNALPEHIVEHWNRIKKMTVGRQKEERKLVNAVFDRSKTGELLLATSKPQFQLLKAQVEKEVAKSTEKSLPKSLFKGKFHLSEEDFQLGLQAGDFCEVVENGKAQYCWQSSEVAKSKEQLRKRELGKTTELDEAQAKLARHHVQVVFEVFVFYRFVFFGWRFGACTTSSFGRSCSSLDGEGLAGSSGPVARSSSSVGQVGDFRQKDASEHRCDQQGRSHLPRIVSWMVWKR